MFGNLDPLLQTIIAGTCAYIAVVIILRISGKRTLAKWNSFDFVITIALGSLLASILTSNKNAFGKGIIGFALLVFFQYIITWVAVRSSLIQKLIKSEPSLLLLHGEMQQDVMTKERIAEGEILAALRANGVSAIEDADAVILETDGSFSVITNIDDSSASALKDVRHFDRSMINKNS